MKKRRVLVANLEIGGEVATTLLGPQIWKATVSRKLGPRTELTGPNGNKIWILNVRRITLVEEDK